MKYFLKFFSIMVLSFMIASPAVADEAEDRISITLYGTMKYKDFEDNVSKFDAKNIELFVRGNLTKRLHAMAEIEFEGVATTEAGSRQGAVEVEQGWLQYDISDYFKIRTGVILVPFGNFNLVHFDPIQDLTDRPIMMRRIIPTTWADAGFGFLGNIPLGDDDFNIDYQVYITQGLKDITSDTSLRGARSNFRSDNNNDKAIAGRVGISPTLDHEIGISGYFGEYDSTGRDIAGFNIDGTLTFGDLEIIGEYAYFDLQIDDTTSTSAPPSNLSGYYVQANYHFWPGFLNDTFLGKGFSDPTFTAVVRWGEANIDDDFDNASFADGDNNEQRLTIGLNYRPVEAFVVKAEYQFNNFTNTDSADTKLENGDNNGFLASVSAAF